ncbi:hypothetical protein OX451_06175 [Citrobacter portucalensis]|uniref:hypothetical protein n=1 Tax=Citrobacter portucalensis TaxID=1639133 RepID=UPI00237A8E75|nr:hypothetical protein [Citrobacter portucalensis]MDQ9156134.1 hypothetical protein [Citrobacter portucalensis]
MKTHVLAVRAESGASGADTTMSQLCSLGYSMAVRTLMQSAAAFSSGNAPRGK